MKWLVDTNVISAASPAKARPDAALSAWLEGNAADICLSVVTIFEVEDGIAKLERKGARRRAQDFRDWLALVELHYAQRLLLIDAEVARLAGRLSDKARGAGVTVGYPDILIAATAAHHGLSVLTRNLRHFAPLGVKALDPAAAAKG